MSIQIIGKDQGLGGQASLKRASIRKDSYRRLSYPINLSIRCGLLTH